MTVRAKRVKRKVERALKTIPNAQEAVAVVDEIVDKAEERVEQEPEQRVPGLAVGDTKTSYTYQDLCSMFPIVSFIPEETIPLTYNGVRVQALQGVEIHVPQCFKRLYDQHRRELRRKPSISDGGQGYVPIIGIGDGALPPE